MEVRPVGLASKPILTPLFRASWDVNGGGHAEVVKCEVSGTFEAANKDDVEVIYQKIQAKKK